MPDISIVIPTHNRPRLLGRLLSSISRQGHTQTEVIVFDDHSSAETSSLVASARWPSLAYARSDEPLGASAARNRGAAMATGSWLWFVDDDDELHGGSIEAVAARLSPETDVLVCLVELAHPDGSRLIPHRQRLPAVLDRSDLLTLTRRPITCSQIVVRADLFRSLGGFDESLASAEDVDLWLRLLTSGARLAVIPDVLLTKHEHAATQLSRNLPNSFAGQRTFLRKWSSTMRSRLGDDQFAAWYYNRLMVTYGPHCGGDRLPYVPLGFVDSLRYAASWWPLMVRGNGQMRARAMQKGAMSLLRALLGVSLFRLLRAAS